MQVIQIKNCQNFIVYHEKNNERIVFLIAEKAFEGLQKNFEGCPYTQSKAYSCVRANQLWDEDLFFLEGNSHNLSTLAHRGNPAFKAIEAKHYHLENANLKFFNAMNANFSYCKFDGALLNFANLQRFCIKASFAFASCVGCKFEYANLKKPSCLSARIKSANFRKAGLEKVGFERAYFGGKLQKLRLKKLKLPFADGIKLRLSDFDFASALVAPFGLFMIPYQRM